MLKQGQNPAEKTPNPLTLYLASGFQYPYQLQIAQPSSLTAYHTCNLLLKPNPSLVISHNPRTSIKTWTSPEQLKLKFV